MIAAIVALPVAGAPQSTAGTAPGASGQGQDAAQALVRKTVDVPKVSALPAPADRKGDTFETKDGAKIFYQQSGSGPAMLLVHGYPLSGALYGRVREALEQNFTVVTLDLRGYGKSTAPSTPDTIGVYADDALALLDHLGIKKAVIGGMSMGGPVVLSMYAKAPDRFRGMVLIDTTASAAPPPEKGLWTGVADVLRSKGKDPVITTLIPDMLTGQTRLDEPAVSTYLTEVMRGSSLDGFIGGALALAHRPDRTDLLPKISVPTLVMVGLQDSLYPIQIARGMATKIPNATLAILPGGSHAAVFEAAGAAGAAMEDWAKALPSQ